MTDAQHTNMYEFGEKGSRFSLESMRKAAALRLKNNGWTSTIHHHAHVEDCAGFDCEYYGPEDNS